MRKAQEEGHCFAQHGIRHNRFELGVPPAMILDLPHEAENRRYASEHRKDLEQEHSIANCRARLKQGRDILENALGFRIEGFRAPALQESPGMFAALAEGGYKFDSSACLQETGWDYIQGNMEVPPRAITRERYEALRRKSGCPIFPLTTDYTWYLTKEKYAKPWNLHFTISAPAWSLIFRSSPSAILTLYRRGKASRSCMNFTNGHARKPRRADCRSNSPQSPILQTRQVDNESE